MRQLIIALLFLTLIPLARISAQSVEGVMEAGRCQRVLERLDSLVIRQQNVAAQHSSIYSQILLSTNQFLAQLPSSISQPPILIAALEQLDAQTIEYKDKVAQLDLDWDLLRQDLCQKDRLEIVNKLTMARAQLSELHSDSQALNSLIIGDLAQGLGQLQISK